jgi:hypothetical protein
MPCAERLRSSDISSRRRVSIYNPYVLVPVTRVPPTTIVSPPTAPGAAFTENSPITPPILTNHVSPALSLPVQLPPSRSAAVSEFAPPSNATSHSSTELGDSDEVVGEGSTATCGDNDKGEEDGLSNASTSSSITSSSSSTHEAAKTLIRYEMAPIILPKFQHN